MLDQGQKSEALQTFYRATEIDPKCVEAWVALARAFHAINPEKYADQMLTCAENAFSADATNSRARNIASVAHFAIGQTAFTAEDWDKGFQHFRRSYEIDPGDGQTFSAMRHCAEEGKLLHHFSDVCEDRLKTHEDDLPVRYALGVSCTKLAIDAPTSPDKVWARTEFLRRAELHLSRYLSSDPLSAHANKFLGIVYIMTNRLSDAEHMLVKLSEIDSEQAAELDELLHD